MKHEVERVFAAQAGDSRHARAEANHLSGTAIFASTFTSAAAEVFRDLDTAHFLAVFLWVADENIDVAFLSEGNQV